jgi:hypothetical protein
MFCAPLAHSKWERRLWCDVSYAIWVAAIAGIQSKLSTQAATPDSINKCLDPELQRFQRGSTTFLMARIYPFRALRYNPSAVRLDDVVTQPYDKISPAM